MICSSVCLLRFIVWSFLKARLQFTSDQFNGATSRLNTPMWNTMEIFDGQGRCLDNSAQRGASNECVRLIRKLRWTAGAKLQEETIFGRRATADQIEGDDRHAGRIRCGEWRDR
jgi:hypothetical protein